MSSSTAGSSQYTSYSSYPGSVSTSYTATTQYTQASDGGGYYNQLPNPAPGAYALPCEFVGLGSCDVTYHYEDTEAWIEHIITDHLQDRLPSKAVCWFCDTYTFDAKSREARNDRRLNFHNRMEHIRQHITDGKTAHDMRPDFHMVDHLYRHRLISQDTYNRVRRWHEPLLSPENTRHVYPPNYIPPERRMQQERSVMAQIDHDKEDRQRKKSKRGKGRT
ncbi:hypothetical protein F5Y13DRAFT_35298 [Hypoxylon sp. FL1857]|nr:hypothetical protein F5Y13DRAFT_35298 [Hypoxylon sp. FL1857]